MLKKVITPQHGKEEEATLVTLNMTYNKGNQLTAMTSEKDKINYRYDKNGSMVEKTLISEQYGKLTDTYGYNTLDQLTNYMGYDGYTQQLAYDANGMRTAKKEAGNGERSTLEELLRGDIAGLPEIITPTVSLNSNENSEDASSVPAELEWATTEYLYDITQEYYQVIEEIASNKNGSTTTAYAYGVERIAAYSDGLKTNYVYDGRGSVAQAITAPVAGEEISSALPDVKVRVQSFAYTAFGEQMGASKASGFGYNGEAYDTATGMINLRARQYEPTLGRFAQKDMFKGDESIPVSLNLYTYVCNTPVIRIDPSGKTGEVVGYGEDGDTDISLGNYFEEMRQIQEEDKQTKINEAYDIAKSVLEEIDDSSLDDAEKQARLSAAYSEIVAMQADLPADVYRMLQEAENSIQLANKNKFASKPQIADALTIIHADACELLMIFADNGFDPADYYKREYINDTYFQGEMRVDYNSSKTKLISSKKQSAESLVEAYAMIASAKQMYDFRWKYPEDRVMRSGAVVCDSLLRIIPKLHFSKQGYMYHEKNGNLRTTPAGIYKNTKEKEKISIYEESGKPTNAASNIDLASVLLRIDVKGLGNHVGKVTRIDKNPKNESIVSVIHAANKKKGVRIDYVNLATQKKYLTPTLPKKTNKKFIVTPAKSTWNKAVRLTYVN